MESGTIVRWLKSAGDAVATGDPLYELDTEKVTQEVEAEVAGVLREVLVQEGEVDVGATIAIIETDDAEAEPSGRGEEKRDGEEADDAEAPSEPDGASVEAGEPPAAKDEKAGATPSAGVSGTVVRASPLARRMAREQGIDLTSIEGTGPEGRVVADDVERAAAGAVAGPARDAATGDGFEVVELTSIRRTIARRLSEAWTAPVFQLGVSADMAEVLHLREALVAGLAEGDLKPTVNDVLTKLAAVALVRHRAVNATFTGEEIHRHASANVGIAVAAPTGLVVPVVSGAERLSIQEIARRRADLVTRARDGKLTLADLEGGTFTISNLGMFGVEQFVAVLNPPQVAILAVGAVKDTPVVVDGALDVAPLVQLTLTCDHRAIDGAEGADFLRTLVALVEQPALAL
jgi:pyruvate dehydrogenase E2 component (dihydrolipoyllysine-residue acetyltransferase)